jgi:hypothetical protein
MMQTRTITVANATVMQLLRQLAALNLISFVDEEGNGRLDAAGNADYIKQALQDFEDGNFKEHALLDD